MLTCCMVCSFKNPFNSHRTALHFACGNGWSDLGTLLVDDKTESVYEHNCTLLMKIDGK